MAPTEDVLTPRIVIPEHCPRVGLATHAALALVVAALCGCAEELPDKPDRSAVLVQPAAAAKAAPGPAQDLGKKKVLLVHSYHPEYPWVDSISKGIRAAIQGTGLELEIFYMDTKRHTDEAWKIEAGKKAAARVREYRPDVVLASDDDAQQFFGKTLVGAGLPVVFTGVDADPTKYGYPAANVTGIIERPHLKESIALARTLRPLKRVAVLSCHDSTSIVALGFMKQEQLEIEVGEWLMVDDFDGWKQAVERFNGTVDGLIVRSYQAVKIPGGKGNVPPKEVADWTIANAKIPTIAFHDFEIKDGMLAGVVKSGEEYGQNAMDYGIRILRGTAPSSLAVTRTKKGIPMVNGETAKRLGITLTDKALDGVTIVRED